MVSLVTMTYYADRSRDKTGDISILRERGKQYRKDLLAKKKREEQEAQAKQEIDSLDKTLKEKSIDKIDFDKKHFIATRKIAIIALILSALSLIAYIVYNGQSTHVSEQLKQVQTQTEQLQQVSGQIKHFQDSILEEAKKDTSGKK